MTIKGWGGRLIRTVLGCIFVISLYGALLCFPEPFFAHAVHAGNLSLHSDRPIPEAAGRQVLRLSREKLVRSPLYKDQPVVGAFLCNSRWREALFFNKAYGAGGVAYPFSSKVFLRTAEVGENRLISPGGTQLPGVRTLDFFVTHEMTHSLTGRAIGMPRYFRLPQWIREGYADYVAWGPAFNYDEARKALLSEAREMDYARSGLYWRFTLLVAHQLDRKRWSVDRLLSEPFPDQQVLESEIRAGRSGR